MKKTLALLALLLGCSTADASAPSVDNANIINRSNLSVASSIYIWEAGVSAANTTLDSTYFISGGLPTGAGVNYEVIYTPICSRGAGCTFTAGTGVKILNAAGTAWETGGYFVAYNKVIEIRFVRSASLFRAANFYRVMPG